MLLLLLLLFLYLTTDIDLWLGIFPLVLCSRSCSPLLVYCYFSGQYHFHKRKYNTSKSYFSIISFSFRWNANDISNRFKYKINKIWYQLASTKRFLLFAGFRRISTTHKRKSMILNRIIMRPNAQELITFFVNFNGFFICIFEPRINWFSSGIPVWSILMAVCMWEEPEKGAYGNLLFSKRIYVLIVFFY